jgi:glutamate---cysteine ligase / carboxylate-amine ligase
MMTFGLEEEFMLVDPGSLEPVPEAREILESLRRDASAGADGTKEFLASQVEHSSRVFSTLPEALAEITAFRDRLAATAAERGLGAASVGVPFQTTPYPLLTPGDRYEEVEHEFRSVVADHQVNGLHVHVNIPDRESGVRALNRVRPWIPVLLALSGNSPFWRGADTGFCSWRSIILRRWVTAGCPPVFEDAADYDRRLRQLVGVGGTVDVETIAWNARLSEHWPTLEFRVFDAQLEAADSVLLAGLARGLVAAALDEDGAQPAPVPPPELLDASLWHAARDGIDGSLVHPVTGDLEPARIVVDAMLDRVRQRLELADDLEFVGDGIDRLFRDGTGAQRQRAAHARGSIIQLGDLIEVH